MSAPFKLWGIVGEHFDAPSLAQLENACRLPVAAAGALMPDAHVGYGLPIGGVLATRGAVIPYAVGVDIACRMKLTVLDIPVDDLNTPRTRDMLARAIQEQTRFGMGAKFDRPNEHAVMDMDWSVSPVTLRFKDKAHSQLGTSGTGNHFVEFGVLEVTHEHRAHAIGPADDPMTGANDGAHPANFNLPPGRYLALLSHSGSRGTGASVCDHYSKVAMAAHPELPKEMRQLAWLDLSSHAGGEYWAAMNLMGHYAAANHAIIHTRIARHLKATVIAAVENHHNFAWKERQIINGREEDVIVHRKGATPAGAGVLGVIPGSMASPGFVVRGRGNAASLLSASHGAGRVMSRTKARDTFAWGNVERELKEKGITVLSAGIDEVPGVYKDIHTVMALQQDLVEPIARFDPKIVKMAPEGEKAED